MKAPRVHTRSRTLPRKTPKTPVQLSTGDWRRTPEGIMVPAGYAGISQGSGQTNIVPALRTWEGYRMEVDRDRLGRQVLVTAGTMPQPTLDISWLKAAAEVYDLSPDPKDYVFTEVPANNADLPNRNMDAFPYDELVKYRPILGMMAYQSYRGKLCVARGTLVDTDRGLVPIEDVKKVGAKSVYVGSGSRKIVEWIDQGIKDTIQITLETGTPLVVTSDHPIQVLTPDLELVDRQAADLKPGDYVAVVVGSTTGPKIKVELPECPTTKDHASQFEGKARSGALNARLVEQVPSEVTPELARILGYLVSEGGVNDTSIISFSNKRDEILDDFRQCWKACFNRDLTESDKGADNRELIDRSVLLREWFSMIGLGFDKAHTKHVPWCILRSAPNLVMEFIRAYWDGDGGGVGSTEFSSASHTLLFEVQQLLRRLGVMSKIRPAKVEGDSHFLYIPHEDFAIFSQKVGTLRTDRKDYHATWEWQRNSEYNYLPFVGDVLLALGEKHRLGAGATTKYRCHDGVERLMSFRVNGASRNTFDCKMNRVSVLGHLAAIHLLCPKTARKIEALLNPRLRFVRVAGNMSFEKRAVFDLSIDSDEHLFPANGVLVHNCSANHDNKDPKKAKGLNFDASMVPIKGHWHTKVISGWCLTGDTLVQTDKGLVSLVEFQQAGVSRVLTQKGWRPVLHWFDRGFRPVVRVTLDGGASLTGTKDHEVKVLNEDLSIGFRAIGTLTPSDVVLVKKGETATTDCVLPPAPTPNPNDKRGLPKSIAAPAQMTPELARILGYLVAEGTCNEKYTLKFTNTDDALIQEFKRCWLESFGEALEEKPDDRGHVDLVACSMLARQWFDQIGLGYETSTAKKVPWSIFRASRQHQLEFLAAYWEGDGSISSAGALRFYSYSPRLREGIHRLLLGLGYHAKIRPTSVDLDVERSCQLVEHLRVTSLCRQSQLDLLKNAAGNRVGERIPHVLDVLRAFKAERRVTEESLKVRAEREGVPLRTLYNRGEHSGKTRWEQETYRADDGSIVSGLFRLPKGTSRTTVSREELREAAVFVQKLSSSLAETLFELARGDLVFCSVKAVEDAGERWVFDIEVEGEPEFWANGFIAHNCRQKDARLAKRILDNKDAGYSMACLIGGASCSVCGYFSQGTVTCRHINGGVGKGTIIHGQLVYDLCRDLNFWELAHVEDRADIDALKDWAR